MSGITGSPGRLVLLGQQRITAPVASVDFVDMPIDSYSAFQAVFTGVRPVNDFAEFNIRTRRENGPFHVGAASYGFVYYQLQPGASAAVGSDGASGMRLADAIGNANREGVAGEAWFYNFESTSRSCQVLTRASTINDLGNIRVHHGSGQVLQSSNRYDGIRFYFSTGNIEVGKFALFGLRGVV